MAAVFGGGSIRLARVFGIRIGVDPSWFLILFLIIWLLSDAYGELFPGNETQAFALATLSALLFFASLLLHELGHALVAIRNGIGIAGIDLWVFGGVAKMTRDTDSPGVEFRVAVAGPLVTLAIALACFGLGELAAGSSGFAEAARFDSSAEVGPSEAVLGYLASINAILLIFNLVPAYPLDGGRLARALAWRLTGDRARATRFAARLGRVLGFGIALVGVFLVIALGWLVGGAWTVLIGLFLAWSARSAELQTAVLARIGGVKVADVMDGEPVAVRSQARLDQALDEFFLRYRWLWFPVVDAGGRFVGVLERDKVEEVPESMRSTRTVDEVTSKEAADTLRVGLDEPLERLLGSEGLRSLGAVMAVDAEGVLRGVVTLDRVRRALRSPGPAL